MIKRLNDKFDALLDIDSKEYVEVYDFLEEFLERLTSSGLISLIILILMERVRVLFWALFLVVMLNVRIGLFILKPLDQMPLYLHAEDICSKDFNTLDHILSGIAKRRLEGRETKEVLEVD